MMENEISIKIPTKKGFVVVLINLFFLMSLFSIWVYVSVWTSHMKENTLEIMLITYISAFLYLIFEWEFTGNRLVSIDSKYLIMYDSIGRWGRSRRLRRERVFRIENMSKLKIDKKYSYSFWQKIKSFWSMSMVGCISFYYEGKKIYFGDGLTVDEALNLINELKEKQFLKDTNFE